MRCGSKPEFCREYHVGIRFTKRWHSDISLAKCLLPNNRANFSLSYNCETKKRAKRALRWRSDRQVVQCTICFLQYILS